MSDLNIRIRAGIWQAFGTVAGNRIRKSLGTRVKKTAEEQCAILEARLWKRHSYGEEAIRTFEEAALHYMQGGGESRFLAPIIKHFKGRTLGSIKPGELRAMATAIYPTAAAATKNRQAIVPARAVIMHGHDLGWCGAIRAKQFEVPKSRKHQAVDRQWLNAFMAEADRRKLPHLSALVLFMHQTGARVGEAVRLMGEHVDLGVAVAVLERTKTATWSPRQLTAELVVRMAGLGLRQGERVFGYTDPKAVTRRIKKVAGDIGIAVLPSHSVGRHSFATNAINGGAGIKEAMDAGGLEVRQAVHGNLRA